MDDDWARCDAEAVVAALSARYHFSRANAAQLLRDEGLLRQRQRADDWANCDAEAVVAALSARYHFSRANAMRLLHDEGILRPRAEAEHEDDDDVEEAEEWGSEEDDSEEEQDHVILPMPGQDLLSVGAIVVGTGESGFQDGAAAAAMFDFVNALLQLPDGCVLVVDTGNNRIRILSADLQQVSTVAGDGELGHRDGAAAQAQFNIPSDLEQLPDGRVLVADCRNHRIRVLSADMQQVNTVAGDSGVGHRDGAAAQAQFNMPTGLTQLPDGRLLVADQGNHRIRVLSADLQQVSTVAGDGEEGHRDGAAAQAQFWNPMRFSLLPDGRVLVADRDNSRLRVLSADLQQVSTVAGDGETGHRDGAVAQAQFNGPCDLVLLPDGRVLVADEVNACIRVLSPDLQQVSTLTDANEVNNPFALELDICALQLLPDGRLLVGTAYGVSVLEGFPATLLSTKPSHKPPKKKKKRALTGGASTTGRLVPKRSRSGASSSSMAAAPSSSDSECEEQPGSAAEAEPLV
jgi:Lon protease-like protein